MRGGVTDAGQQTTEQTLKIELLSQWKLEAEFRNTQSVEWSFAIVDIVDFVDIVGIVDIGDNVDIVDIVEAI